MLIIGRVISARRVGLFGRCVVRERGCFESEVNLAQGVRPRSLWRQMGSISTISHQVSMMKVMPSTDWPCASLQRKVSRHGRMRVPATRCTETTRRCQDVGVLQIARTQCWLSGSSEHRLLEGLTERPAGVDCCRNGLKF